MMESLSGPLRFLIFSTLLLIWAGCSKPSSDGFYYGSLGGKQKLIITSTTSATASPFLIVQYSLDGVFEKVLYDLTFENRVPRGLAMIDPFTFLISTDTVDGILQYSYFNGVSTWVANANLAGNIYNVAKTSNGDVFVIESNTIESFDSTGNRIGAPRIGTTIGGCTLSTARGMAVTANDILVVGSQANDDILFYDVSNPASTTCAAANGTLGNVDPIAIVAHPDGYVYVAHTGGTDAVLRFNGDGSGASTSVFSNLTVIANPTSMVALPDGTLLVASDTTNNIVRIDTAGNVLNNPFIQDGFTAYVYSMMIMDVP